MEWPPDYRGGGGVCQGTISTGIISPGGNFATFLNGDIFPSRNPPPPCTVSFGNAALWNCPITHCYANIRQGHGRIGEAAGDPSPRYDSGFHFKQIVPQTQTELHSHGAAC